GESGGPPSGRPCGPGAHAAVASCRRRLSEQAQTRAGTHVCRMPPRRRASLPAHFAVSQAVGRLAPCAARGCVRARCVCVSVAAAGEMVRTSCGTHGYATSTTSSLIADLPPSLRRMFCE
ncbi:unnamed protein product, partial [Ixodes pacificus]